MSDNINKKMSKVLKIMNSVLGEEDKIETVFDVYEKDLEILMVVHYQNMLNQKNS